MTLFIPGLLLPGSPARAAEAVATAEGGSLTTWSVVIALLVCSVAASVAYLCYFAVRLWNGYWKSLALAPLGLLGLWLTLILVGMLTGLAPRALWTVEILAWAMGTAVYLVTLFTARRAFEKADATDQNKG
jgi:hypothetical protein